MFEVEPKLRQGTHADDDDDELPQRERRRSPGKTTPPDFVASTGEPGKQLPSSPMRPLDAICYGLALASPAKRAPRDEGSFGNAFAFLDLGRARSPMATVHRHATGGALDTVSRDELEALIEDSRGEALPAALAKQLEADLGDLDEVRVHTGGAANAAARFLQAEAFALGNDIFFAEGKYDPSSPSGQRLIAHEVAHTAQHSAATTGAELAVSSPGDAHEVQADAFAESFEMPAAPVPFAGIARTPAPTARFVWDPATMLKPATASVKKAGTVQHVEAMRAGDNVIVQTPGVLMNATVVLTQGTDPGSEPIKCGWVQTVVSSERIGVYYKDGVVVRRDITRFNATRDGKSGVAAPWYETPLALTKEAPDQYPVAEDQPKLTMAAELDGAKLQEIQGADVFRVSVMVGPEGNLTRLKSFSWSAPWSVTLDAQQSGAGGDVAISAADSHTLPTSNRPANEVGTDPANRIQTYETVAAATEGLGRQGITTFIKDMPKHERLAANSYWNMVSALWASSAKFHVLIEPLGDDPAMPLKLVGTSTVDFGEVETKNKEYSALAHTVYDPGKIKPGDFITVQFRGTSVASLTWPYERSTTKDVKWDDDLFNIVLWLA